MTKYTSKDTHRFWQKVNIGKPDDCWEWQAFRDNCGYGRFRINRRTVKATRLAYEMTTGTIPDGLLVCHKCDNPACVNPNHLWLGTDADNNRDMVAKGREAHPRGSKHGRAKLTEANVQEIRTLYQSGQIGYRPLARKFNVSLHAIYAIIKRKIWKSVP